MKPLRITLARAGARARPGRAGRGARPGPLDAHGLELGAEQLLAGRGHAGPGQAAVLLRPRSVTGLHRTAPSLRQTGTADPVIPPRCSRAEGYNHVGDIGYQGGRVLLPLECYTPGGPNGGNTCGTGSIGVADPATLAFQYYVKLDPAEIPKAMWVEASPDGQLLWTSSGPDLLAYNSGDVTAGERGAGRRPDPCGAAAGGRRAPERGHRCGVLPRAAAPRRRPGHHLPGLVGGRGDRRAPARAGAAECPGRGRGARAGPAARRRGSTSSWRRWPRSRPSGRRSACSTSRPDAGRAAA